MSHLGLSELTNNTGQDHFIYINILMILQIYFLSNFLLEYSP